MQIWVYALALFLLGSSFGKTAKAEGWMLDGTAALGTGLEGGDPGGGQIEWRRARTRISAGVDLRSDEAEQDSLGFRGFAELERRGGVGAEARYERWIGRGFGGFVFGTAVLVPETLVGAGVGATFVIPFGTRVGFGIEPAFAALPFGSDVPDDSVLLLATLSIGIRVGL
jgi:hypothetical protein